MQFRDIQRTDQWVRPQIEAAIRDVVSEGCYVMGHWVPELEERLARYVGVKHCITCANGTDALRLALMAWGVGEGDAVFLPDFTFFATAEAVALQGAIPIFVDVDCRTFNISVADLKEKISNIKAHTTLRCRAVVAVDLFGQPAAFDELLPVVRDNDMLLLEDGAQGFGGELNGRRACSFGDVATTSFFPAKPLGCYGDGGALFTNDDAVASAVRSLRQHGKGEDKYHNVRLGLNSRLDTVQAAVLKVKLEAFEERGLQAVQEVAKSYDSLLQGLVDCPQVGDGIRSSWAQYTIVSHRRDDLNGALKEASIPTAIYYPLPMHNQPALQMYADMQSPCPNTERLCRTVLSLPIYPFMTEDECHQVVSVIERTIEKK
ncbi:MAG: DegT/DnrJ/EryC1/StrS family aminotransferase [Bacteroidales bacterium]|nr:DegT/DnrJ/EryC1/StrS family aminotransferase [Bacteroidales bacterium]